MSEKPLALYIYLRYEAVRSMDPNLQKAVVSSGPSLSIGKSGKPKVYQGVRVKITVKELLQQRRARQAETGASVSWDSSSIQFSESVSPPHPAPFDTEPISSVPNYCPPWQFSNRLSCEESPSYLEQLVDSCLQADADPAFNAFQTPSHYTSDTFQPVPLCFNQDLAAGSPSSADLSSPLNYSCSPPQLSPLTPLTHSPLSAPDTRTYSYPAEEWSCHTPSPYTTSTCCCTACASQHVDSRVPQYFCPSTDCMDYLPPMADDFFRRIGNVTSARAAGDCGFTHPLYPNQINCP